MGRKKMGLSEALEVVLDLLDGEASNLEMRLDVEGDDDDDSDDTKARLKALEVVFEHADALRAFAAGVK